MARQPRQAGQVIGRAGVGLTGDVSWAANAEVAARGRDAELRTAEVLNALARVPGGPTILHDLRIPIPGFKANIDHIVVSGRTITIIDTKTWKPGFYWTLAGVTRRGLERFAPADKKTIPAAYASIEKYLRAQGITANFNQPALVVWPSNSRAAMRLWLLRSPGARAVQGGTFERNPAAWTGARTADRHIVQALSQLTN